jgi:hypothetical protein
MESRAPLWKASDQRLYTWLRGYWEAMTLSRLAHRAAVGPATYAFPIRRARAWAVERHAQARS